MPGAQEKLTDYNERRRLNWKRLDDFFSGHETTSYRAPGAGGWILERGSCHGRGSVAALPPRALERRRRLPGRFARRVPPALTVIGRRLRSMRVRVGA
jgi:hypothetical protein